MADGVVVPLGVGVVGLEAVSEHDPLEPLDRSVAVFFRNYNADRTAASRCEPLIIELITEHHRMLARRVFQDAAYRQRTLEPLRRVIVVEAVEEDAPDIFLRTSQPHYFAHRHAFP